MFDGVLSHGIPSSTRSTETPDHFIRFLCITIPTSWLLRHRPMDCIDDKLISAPTYADVKDTTHSRLPKLQNQPRRSSDLEQRSTRRPSLRWHEGACSFSPLSFWPLPLYCLPVRPIVCSMKDFLGLLYSIRDQTRRVFATSEIRQPSILGHRASGLATISALHYLSGIWIQSA